MNPLPEEYSEAAAAAQLQRKREYLTDLLTPLGAPEPEVHASAPIHFRQRAEFRIWHEGEETFYLMFGGPDSREQLRLREFPTASRRINVLMTQLLGLLTDSPVLKRKLWQVEFLDTLAGDSLVTLVYHRRLDEEWEHAARKAADGLGAMVVGRSRGQRVVLERDWVLESLEVEGQPLSYRQPEGSFTQPNAAVNQSMLGWARRACAASGGGDLLELYCGIGNFTVAVAGCFRQVLATEIGTGAISAARHNLAVNGIDNTFVARLSSAEAASAMARERPFRRLKDFDLDTFHPQTLLVDPPRAGLDRDTLALAAGFSRIVYVSCNPQSLCRDLQALGPDFRITRTALFDQFPYTPHMECGVLLERQSSGGLHP
jgi:tRNA (uracil-5-)-methyltransferase